MGNYELIEELCSVARLQADIIQKQAEVIAQAEIAESQARKRELHRKRGLKPYEHHYGIRNKERLL